jgi:hemolysin activation/secretion protein
VVPVLRAGQTPGTVDVDLKVKDSPPVHASVDVNNRYTANTSPTRVGVNFSYDNLFNKMHSLALQYQTAPEQPSEARVIAGTYSIPAGDNNRLAFYAIDTASDVSAIGALSVLGAGRIYGLRYVMPLPGSANLSHSFTLGPDYKDFRDTIRLSDGSDQTPIHYLVWVGTYSGIWQTPSTLTTFTVGPTFGVRGLVNDSDEFAYKRSGADGNFFYLRAAVTHERPLAFGTRVFLRLTSQWTAAPLISNEQLALGGLDTVRGYLEAEALGDEGMSGALEWRAPFPGRFGELWSRSYVFAFYDAGYVRTLEALPGQSSRTSLSSWGLGLRVLSVKGLQASLDWAVPRESTVNTRAEDSRVNFDVSYGF